MQLHLGNVTKNEQMNVRSSPKQDIDVFLFTSLVPFRIKGQDRLRSESKPSGITQVVPVASMFSSLDYNALPSVETADNHAAALADSNLRTKLLNIIAEHNVQDLFNVRLVHRHFDIEGTEVAVFQPLTISGIGDVVIMGPLSSSDMPKYFPQNYAVKDGQLLPFEYTTRKGPNVADYPNFAEAFATEIAAANACNIFGLATVTTGLPNLYEFEVPQLRCTVMIPPKFLPLDEDGVRDIHTEWAPHSHLPTTAGPVSFCRSTPYGHHKKPPPVRPLQRGDIEEPSDSSIIAHPTVAPDGPMYICRSSPYGHQRLKVRDADKYTTADNLVSYIFMHACLQVAFHCPESASVLDGIL